ncbi:MAG TPA: hypothetical protein VNG53_07600 [Bacteroidia bacterium]|nr:hypothetical protein [Bacteroidia bacterium]
MIITSHAFADRTSTEEIVPSTRAEDISSEGIDTSSFSFIEKRNLF